MGGPSEKGPRGALGLARAAAPRRFEAVEQPPGPRPRERLDAVRLALLEVILRDAAAGAQDLGFALHLAIVEQSQATASLASQEDVGGRRQFLNQIEFLVNDADSRRFGVPRSRAGALADVARWIAEGDLSLEPGSDAAQARRALMEIDGVGEGIATAIVMRAMSWPDAFAPSDPALGRAAGTSSAAELRRCAEAWRPWRSYAALHLWLADTNP